MELLESGLRAEVAKFSGNLEKSKNYLSVGESAIDTSIPLDAQAAWTAVAQLLLNLSETITRN